MYRLRWEALRFLKYVVLNIADTELRLMPTSGPSIVVLTDASGKKAAPISGASRPYTAKSYLSRGETVEGRSTTTKKKQGNRA